MNTRTLRLLKFRPRPQQQTQPQQSALVTKVMRLETVKPYHARVIEHAIDRLLDGSVSNGGAR